MTVQLSQIETGEPRLFADSYIQKSQDISFEEKLKAEKERLGLLFSPLAQFASMFGYSPLADNPLAETDLNYTSIYKNDEQSSTKPTEENVPFKLFNNFRSLSQRAAGLSETLPFNRQLLQNILIKTNWLVPNLAAQPSFFLASLNGELSLSLNLQALVDEIVKNAELVKNHGRVEFSLSLKPEELGEMVLTLTSQMGAISINIQASEETKKLLDSRRTELEASLKKANIICDRITVEEVKEDA